MKKILILLLMLILGSSVMLKKMIYLELGLLKKMEK